VEKKTGFERKNVHGLIARSSS